MEKEKKRDYQLRISQANKAELIVILYEIALDYLDEAVDSHKNRDINGYKDNLKKLRDCIEEMVNNLHFEKKKKKKLKEIYLYMKKVIREDIISGNTDNLDSVRKTLQSLHDSYEQVKGTDKSSPVMANTQAVLTGMTYSKNKVLNELTQDCTNRGFRV